MEPKSLPASGASWRIIASGEPDKFVVLEMNDLPYIPLMYYPYPVVATQAFLADLVRATVDDVASAKVTRRLVPSMVQTVIKKLMERPDVWIQTPDNDVIPLSVHPTWDWGRGMKIFIETFPISVWLCLDLGSTIKYRYRDDDPHLRSQLSHMQDNINLLRTCIHICNWNIIKEMRPENGSCPGIYNCHILFHKCICFSR